MGAKASTLWYIDVPDPRSVLREQQPDFESAFTLAARLYPDRVITPASATPLSEAAKVDVDDTVYIGTYPGVTVLCAADLTVSHPSTLPESRVRHDGCARTFFVASEPDIARGSFAVWEDGNLKRSFSATPVHIHEDLGIPLLWERPFWAGDFPLRYPPGVLPDPQSLPFHPQQFAEGANRDWLGFRYTGRPTDGELDPTAIAVHGFALHHPEPNTDTQEVQQDSAIAPVAPVHRRGAFRRYFGF